MLRGCIATVHDCVGSDFYMTDQETGEVDPEPLIDYEPEVINALQPHLEEVYTTIAQAAPNATIVVLGYPRIFPGDENAPSCWVDAAVEFTADITSWTNEMTDLLEQVISDSVQNVAADGYDIRYVNPNPGFAGHEICSSDPRINGIVAWSQSGSGYNVPGVGSFHPKATGQQEHATLVEKCLSGQLSC